jgi:hypothetical protein
MNIGHLECLFKVHYGKGLRSDQRLARRYTLEHTPSVSDCRWFNTAASVCSGHRPNFTGRISAVATLFGSLLPVRKIESLHELARRDVLMDAYQFVD